MLVKGWTIMGTCVSSYGNTMGFSASTQVAEESTRKAVTLFHNLSYKINQLLQEKHKMSPLERGTSEISGLRILNNSKMPYSIRFAHSGHDIWGGRRVLCLII